MVWNLHRQCTMKELENFSPPFCPNENCKHHEKPQTILGEVFWISRGYEKRKFSSNVRNFQCKSCKKRFCSNYFSINYCYKKHGHINARVFQGVVEGRSNRAISRTLGVSEGTVRLRISRLAQIAVFRHASFLESLKIAEPVAFDGVECFARSQYEPNNINQLIGVNSLFCYTFNFAPLNRKGRMSDRQKNYLKKLEVLEGRFNPRAIRISSAELFKDAVARLDPRMEKLILQTDEHFQYKRAIRRDLTQEERGKIDHRTVSSKATRNYKNILFAVNHTDLLLRQNVAAFARETISFAKKHSRMMQKYTLLICHKNYMRPKFVKPHKRDPKANIDSPAMSLGLCSKPLKFHEFFTNPKGLHPNKESRKKLPKDWQLLINDEVSFKREHKYCKKKQKKRLVS